MRPDVELFEAWVAGDTCAGSALFSRHFDSVRRFFANKVHDASEVEDLVQRTFASCVEGRERFAARSTFRAYLLGIARKHCFKYWERRRREPVTDEIGDHPIAAMTDRPSGALARDATQRMLLQALRNIPLREQAIIELYYWEELSGREIGEVLGLPEDTVRSTLRRAKHKLHKQLRRMQELVGVPESTDEDLQSWADGLRANLLNKEA